MAVSVGFIGVGNMGNPMAGNVLKAGFPLPVFDKSPGAMENLVQAGAKLFHLLLDGRRPPAPEVTKKLRKVQARQVRRLEAQSAKRCPPLLRQGTIVPGEDHERF